MYPKPMRLSARLCLQGILLLLPAGVCPAQGQVRQGPYHATPQRPTFTSDTSTTEPGTAEFESGLAFSKDFFGVPVNVKFTLDVPRGPLHRMEFSVAFLGISSLVTEKHRMTQFGNSLGLTVRRPVYTGRSFSLALAPRALFFLRDERGSRIGLTGIAAYSHGRSSLVTNIGWTGATDPSTSNPQGYTRWPLTSPGPWVTVPPGTKWWCLP